MKKSLSAVIMLSLFSVNISAFAAQPEFEGSLTLRNTNETGVGSDFDYRLGLQLTQEIAPNLTMTGKLVFYNEDLFPVSNKQHKYGYPEILSLSYAFPEGKSTLLVGKNALTYGNGLVIDDTVTQVTFATSLDKYDIQLSAFDDKYSTSSQDDALGASIQTTLGKLGLGASYVKQDVIFRNWAVNGTYTTGPWALGAEFTKNTVTDGEASYLTATYGQLEEKDDISYKVGYVRVEPDSIAGYTTLSLTSAGDYKGFTYSISYNLSEKSSLCLQYNDLDELATGDSVDRTRIIFEQLF